MYAAVDLGSNSFRLHIGQHDGKAIRVLKTARDQIRLAAGLDRDGNLTPAAMETALASLRGFGALLAGYQLDAVRVVATSAMRTARNAQAFLPQAEAALGYPIDIISGEEEGRLIYMGVSYALGDSDERRLVIDIGGGSTELILGAGAQIEQVESYSIGTVPHSQAFFLGGAITEQGFDAAVLAARSRFEDAVPHFARRHWQRCHGSSGTMRTLAETIARNGIGDGRLTLASLQALRERLIGFGHVERIALPGIKAERAPSIAGGLAILLGIALELEIDEIHPVDAGLRMGVMADLHLRATRRDRRELSVRAFLRK
ncbi:MAG TPA: Ppx/GppA family phosphatase, partial [Burkholderiaceae bacterium]